MGLDLSDMLYIPAKSAEYNWGGSKELSKSTLNKVKEKFKDSVDWKYLDAANKKLDEYAGQIENYSNKLHEYEHHLKIAQSKCIYKENKSQELQFDSVQQCLNDYASAVTLQSWSPLQVFPALDDDELSAVLPSESSVNDRYEIDV